MRYFVVSNQPSSALRLLEQTVFRVPMVDTSGREKFLKLPPASVCNKVLDSAAQVRGCEGLWGVLGVGWKVQVCDSETESSTLMSCALQASAGKTCVAY